ncbi:MAG: hypothetical protein P4N59_25750, partial [Negativicutes bacterium]|nr:hypothetical protein [Negativicutes bacterium]
VGGGSIGVEYALCPRNSPSSRFPGLCLGGFGDRYKHVAADLSSLKRSNEMEVAPDAADDVEAEQIEDLLSPALNILEISRGLAFPVEQVPKAAPVQRIPTTARYSPPRRGRRKRRGHYGMARYETPLMAIVPAASLV